MNIKYLVFSILISSLYGQDDDDMDAMWDNTIWNEIEDIADEEIQEVDNITAVAGTRGAEAEDEALALLYYRRSMKGLSKLDLQRALGKLIIKRQKISDDSATKKIDSYIYQLKIKLKNTWFLLKYSVYYDMNIQIKEKYILRFNFIFI